MILSCFIALIGLFASHTPYAQGTAQREDQSTWSLANVDGRWSSGDCRAKYYDYNVQGNETHVRDQRGALDIERIIEVRKDGFSAITESSSSSIGTRWRYTFDGDQVRIEDLTTRRQFVQTRCNPVNADIRSVLGTATRRRIDAHQAILAILRGGSVLQPG
jgi:hypothetical protein